MTSTESGRTLMALVHGAWHSSVHWAATQRILAHHGMASIAVDLPGHGVDAPVPSGYLAAGQPGLETEKSALAEVTMQDAADAVTTHLAAVRSRFDHLVVVAHSAGGGPVSLAAEQNPQLIDRIIYLSAFVPAGRPRFTDYINADENASAAKLPMVGEPAVLGAHRINPLSADPTIVESVRSAFLNDLPDCAPDGWRHLLHPDEPYSSLTAPVEITARRWGRIPRSYIRLTDDLALPPVTQDLMIAESDVLTPDSPLDVRNLSGGHSPFVTRPDELASLLVELAVPH